MKKQSKSEWSVQKRDSSSYSPLGSSEKQTKKRHRKTGEIERTAEHEKKNKGG